MYMQPHSHQAAYQALESRRHVVEAWISRSREYSSNRHHATKWRACRTAGKIHLTWYSLRLSVIEGQVPMPAISAMCLGPSFRPAGPAGGLSRRHGGCCLLKCPCSWACALVQCGCAAIIVIYARQKRHARAAASCIAIVAPPGAGGLPRGRYGGPARVRAP